jgi:hypothetical protein
MADNLEPNAPVADKVLKRQEAEAGDERESGPASTRASLPRIVRFFSELGIVIPVMGFLAAELARAYVNGRLSVVGLDENAIVLSPVEKLDWIVREPGLAIAFLFCVWLALWLSHLAALPLSVWIRQVQNQSRKRKDQDSRLPGPEQKSDPEKRGFVLQAVLQLVIASCLIPFLLTNSFYGQGQSLGMERLRSMALVEVIPSNTKIEINPYGWLFGRYGDCWIVVEEVNRAKSQEPNDAKNDPPEKVGIETSKTSIWRSDQVVTIVEIDNHSAPGLILSSDGKDHWWAPAIYYKLQYAHLLRKLGFLQATAEDNPSSVSNEDLVWLSNEIKSLKQLPDGLFETDRRNLSVPEVMLGELTRTSQRITKFVCASQPEVSDGSGQQRAKGSEGKQEAGD